MVGTDGGDESVVFADPSEEVEGGEGVEVEGEEGGEGGWGEVGDEGVKGGVFSPLGFGEDAEELRGEIGLLLLGEWVGVGKRSY